MSLALVLASIDRAGDHAAVLGVVVAVAGVGGVVYGLVRIVVKGRARRTRPTPGPGSDRRPDA
jgi:hypothetical protein